MDRALALGQRGDAVAVNGGGGRRGHGHDDQRIGGLGDRSGG
jgi:hypothetical protein